MTKQAHKHCPDCGIEIPVEDSGETYIKIVLDESGSMSDTKSDTIGGFNEYIATLKKNDVKGKISLVKFNSYTGVKTVFSNRLIHNALKLSDDDYTPGGCTPLYDAVGMTIKDADKADSDKVIIVIITDGLENASQKYNQSSVRELIEDRQRRGWTFVYLGANQDSWAAGGSIGISHWTISDYNPIHTRHLYGAAATMTCNYASTGSIGESAADAVGKAISSS